MPKNHLDIHSYPWPKILRLGISDTWNSFLRYLSWECQGRDFEYTDEQFFTWVLYLIKIALLKFEEVPGLRIFIGYWSTIGSGKTEKYLRTFHVRSRATSKSCEWVMISISFFSYSFLVQVKTKVLYRTIWLLPDFYRRLFTISKTILHQIAYEVFQYFVHQMT